MRKLFGFHLKVNFCRSDVTFWLERWGDEKMRVLIGWLAFMRSTKWRVWQCTKGMSFVGCKCEMCIWHLLLRRVIIDEFLRNFKTSRWRLKATNFESILQPYRDHFVCYKLSALFFPPFSASINEALASGPYIWKMAMNGGNIICGSFIFPHTICWKIKRLNALKG